jgi:hypothetical protein
VGAITGSSVELLLNANDNAGTIAYTISYSGGSFTIYNPSGMQKSVVIPNLASNTTYTFTVTAADMSGNPVANNPIVLNATTTINPECNGNDTQASEGTFTFGYNYSFQTIGNDVKITFTLLDSKVGLVAFLRRQSPFAETQMSNVSGQTFTQTITNQTAGSTINYAVKFAYAGGLSVTRYISYVVGQSCNLDIKNNQPLQFSFINPVQNEISISSANSIDAIEIFDMLGKKIITQYNQSTADVSKLSSGIYILKVTSGDKIGTKKIIKKG